MDALAAARLALLLLVVAVLVWRGVLKDRQEYARFRRLHSTEARQKVYRRWLLEGFGVFAGLTALILLAVGSEVGRMLDALRAAPPVSLLLPRLDGGLGAGLGIGLSVAFLAGLLLPAVLLRGKVDEIPAIGDVQALLPRNRRELGWGAGMSINAGVMEELLFRLAVPTLLFAVLVDALAGSSDGPAALLAAGIAIVLFGALHAYQGWRGAVMATVLGLVFFGLYAVTGMIWVPIVVHALFDLRSMVLLPIAIGGAWRAR
ncbi:CPBP family intramembrane glutamic endopeptidase [Schumannella sp. 10F1B-5-1]|uniref:CPBP family intramembrane glutamic endopeptidase n=1 Tax=Schumannella sp. 10F1B-5-1 TaxID=2590780 RepID=UPI0015E8376D|nr:CPBP family intramembrane glutamic endopeptidase [Schumannella sp. 10F1B-5-1]